MLPKSINTVIYPGHFHTTDSYLVKFNLIDVKKHKVKTMNQRNAGRTKEALNTYSAVSCCVCFFHVFYHNEGKWQQIMRKFITIISS